jgi:ribonuclease HI
MSLSSPSIFCDGACRGNGTKKAIGGWAWAYWPGSAVGEPTAAAAEPLAQPATNQRAELKALLEALRWWLSQGSGPIDVYTDSMYTINCTSVWGPAWHKKSWSRSSGEPLQNLDIIKPLVALYAAEGKGRWRLHHVRGHQTGSSPEAHGNNWVDQAAVAASLGSPIAFCKKLFVHPEPEPDPEPDPDSVITHVTAQTKPKPDPKPDQKPDPKIPKMFAPPRQTDIRLWFS